VASSSDHRIVATGSYDGTIALFDRDDESWRTVRPTAAGISSIVYDEHANCFVAGSYDGELYRISTT
jgi:WD40 repeat protein